MPALDLTLLIERAAGITGERIKVSVEANMAGILGWSTKGRMPKLDKCLSDSHHSVSLCIAGEAKPKGWKLKYSSSPSSKSPLSRLLTIEIRSTQPSSSSSSEELVSSPEV